LVHELTIENDAYPSPLNYYGFPKSVCTSVNEVICHGIPDLRPLENGDILNIDISIYYKGYHSDMNETYLVGECDKESKHLVQSAYTCLQKAIEICKPGTLYKEVGNVISKYIEAEGLSVVKTYCGHGVGKLFHCNPNIPHYKNNKAVGSMKAGHIFTIEPMINKGNWKDVTWLDNWTAVTADGLRSAQFEHTILITDTGCEVLTERLDNSPILEIFK
jgi:methionyl aminopeptidase